MARSSSSEQLAPSGADLRGRPGLERACNRGGASDQRRAWLARGDVVIFEIVFGPGRITAHRVRGAIVLYLSIAIVFAWLYRLIAEAVPAGFSGFGLAADHVGLEPISLLQSDLADDSRTGRHHAG